MSHNEHAVSGNASLPENERLTAPLLEGNGASTNPKNGQLRTKELVDRKRPYYNLSKQKNFLFFVPIYVALFLASWIIICKWSTLRYHGRVATRRPDSGNYKENTTSVAYLRAARILHAVASVLAIPMASAVSARAAAVYAQFYSRKPSSARPPKLTMRQTMALADNGWADLTVISRTLFGGWQRYGSGLLGISTAIVILGAIIPALHQLLVFEQMIKIPTGKSHHVPSVHDAAQLCTMASTQHAVDDQERTLVTRLKLSSTNPETPQPLLWAAEVCLEYDLSVCRPQTVSAALSQFSRLNDPFFSPVAFGVNTGFLIQYAPRYNSSTQYINVSAAEYPQNCKTLPGSFFVSYNYESSGANFEACMPGNMTKVPWKPTRDRQDFQEELYLKFSMKNRTLFGGYTSVAEGDYYAKITVDTTAGYFELPNYRNNGQPTPLLARDPFSDDKTNDQLAFYEQYEPFQDPPAVAGLAHDNSLFDPVLINNAKGPLFDVAVALFGNASFFDIMNGPLATKEGEESYYSRCIDKVPLAAFTTDDLFSSDVNPCIRSYGKEEDRAATHAADYASALLTFDRASAITSAFNAATYLSTESWAASKTDHADRKLRIDYHPGSEMLAAKMSLPAMIALSILLGLFLASLLALSIYSVARPSWTPVLNSFAMMRIGATMGSQLPLLAVDSADTITELDTLPGWMGSSEQIDDKKKADLIWGGDLPLRKDFVNGFYDKKRWEGAQGSQR